MKALDKKLKAVEEEHAVEVVAANLEEHSTRKQQQAFLLLGGIRAVNRVSENLSSQVMSALIEFFNQDGHTYLGYKRSADFLDESEYSPMKKSEFYRRKDLYDAEGGQLYDTFNAARIPISTRRLLAAKNGTEIAIDGNEIVIGDERADLSDLPTIKALINDFASDNKKLIAEKEKLEDKVTDRDDKIKAGTAENEELRRNLDAANTRSPFERAMSNAVGSMIALADAVKDLTDKQRKKRGPEDLKLFAQQYFNLSDAYGVKRSLSASADEGDNFLDKGIAEMVNDGSIDDLD